MGNKQRREYLLDEHGERIRDEAGNYVFNAVPTTDWGSPDTLEHWRQAWAELCNAKFVEKGLDCRIDHRSYERQGVEQLPTVHEGPTVKAMEKKGIRTDKGDLNRWIRKTNAMLREAKQKIASLIGWLKEVKVELSAPQPPTLVELLSAYYDTRNKGAYSGKAKIGNLKKFSEAVSYLESKQLRTTEDLNALLNSMQEQIDTLKESASGKQTRIKELDELLRMADYYQQGKLVADKLKTIRFDTFRQKYKAERCQAKVLGTPKTNVNLTPLPCPRGPRGPLGQGRGVKRKLVRYDTVTISTYTGYYRPCTRLTVQESRDCVRSYSRIFRANSRVL